MKPVLIRDHWRFSSRFWPNTTLIEIKDAGGRNSFGGSNWTDSISGSSSGNVETTGFVFGGTVGANYQTGAFVLGVEADADWADASGFGTFTATPLCAAGCLTKSVWLATVRGRLGYAFDRSFVYGTGGAAFGDIRANFSNGPSTDETRSGWTAGAGNETALGSNLTAKAVYLFVNLPSGSCTTNCAIQNSTGPAFVPNVAVKFNESTVRAGINYKFGG